MVNAGQRPFIFYRAVKKIFVKFQVNGSYHLKILLFASREFLSITALPRRPKMSVSIAAPRNAAGPNEGEKSGGEGGAILPEALPAISRAAAICASLGIPADPTLETGPRLAIAPGTPVKVFCVSNKEVSENPYRQKVAVSASSMASALGIPGAYQSRYAYTCTRFYGVEPPKVDPFVENMMAQGRKYEPIIFNLLKKSLRRHHYVTPSGFMLDSTHPTLCGASPDGLLWRVEDGCFDGVVEIKYRDRAARSAAPDQIPLKYLIQIAGQLMCTISNRFCYVEGKYEGPHEGIKCSIFSGTVDRRFLAELRGMLLDYLELAAKHTKDTFPKRISGMPKDEHYRKAFKINRIY